MSNLINRHALPIQPTKTMEKCIAGLFEELEEIAENETKSSGKTNLYSYYCQAMVELAYQLQTNASKLALDLPKRLEHVTKVMLILNAWGNRNELPKNALKSLPVTEHSMSIFGKYLILSSIPKQLTADEIEDEVKSQLFSLHGLAVEEVSHFSHGVIGQVSH